MITTGCFAITGRYPHGERGLKYFGHQLLEQEFGRSPHGERGLKCACMELSKLIAGRSPHGERGLKFSN